MIKPIPADVPPARLWARVEVRQLHECWPWLGKKHASGYGTFHFLGKEYPAHRVALALWRGEDIPGHLVVDHLCRNRSCCNPMHLEPVTSAVNVQRGEVGRHGNHPKRPVIDGITYCSNWHPVEGSNAVLVRDRRRDEFRVACRGCNIMWAARYRKAA